MGHPEGTRERILSGARQLFAEKGFDGATTAEIARRAGIAEGTIYRHFESKKELFIACVKPAVDEALERGVSEIQNAGDLRGMVRAMMEARVRLLEENRDSFNILVTQMTYHPELAEMFLEQVFVARSAKLVPVLQKLIQTGELRRPPNFLIIGLGMTMAVWAIMNFRDRLGAIQDRYPATVSSENLVDELTDFVLYGIAGQP